jgi:glycosyltransferase involved in cell wall biosynthesis
MGQQTATFVPRLAERGYEIAVSAANSLAFGMTFWQGIPVLPGDSGDLIGPRALQRNVRLFGPDLVIALSTPWAARYEPVGVPFASFCPIEHNPISPQAVNHYLVSGAVPFAVTRDGEALMREAGLSPLYVPHGIDTNVFRPLDRAETRHALGVPESTFLVGTVATNKPDNRKSFSEAMAAFAAFHDQHPDSLLLMHTYPLGGVDVLGLAHDLGFGDAVRLPDQDKLAAGLIGPEDMARMYSALDVLLSPSRGEGFGLPLLEAQACGIPVIVTDFGSMPEIGAVGWKVDGQPEYVPALRAWCMAPSIDSITDALHDAFEHDGSLAAAAREHALQYDANLVCDEYLVPAIESLVVRQEVVTQ